ncbi:hypothetical protein BZA70DRAFT_283198 [Myxozyma melibiosi]|uniref:SAP domain-containing protein n=1 Tax=Myxozyma melibiosi TaxID=54550 RepID=A0ABR1F1K8_9ASCO
MISTSRIAALKKKDLVDLASQLGVETDGFKTDLEGRIARALSQNSERMRNDARFSQFYRVTSSPYALSRPRKSLVTVSPDKKPLSPRSPFTSVLTSKSTPSPSPLSASDSEESSESGEEGSHYWAALKSKLSSYYSSAGDAVSTSTEYSVTTAQQSGLKLREKVSSVAAIDKLVAFYELFLIVKEQFPLSYKVDYIAIPFADYKLTTPTVHLPEPFAASTYKPVWEPFVFWALYFVAIPLVLSFFINFTSSKSTPAKARRTFDPVTFNIVKLLSAYLLFVKLSTVTDSFVAGSTVVTASHPTSSKVPFAASASLISAVLGNIPFVGSAIGTLAAIYSAILIK